MSPEEFELWKRDNVVTDDFGRVVRFKGELSIPNPKVYPNAKYQELLKDKAAAKYYNTLYRNIYDHTPGYYLRKQRLIPMQMRPGSRIPSIRKDLRDRMIEQGPGSYAKEVYRQNTRVMQDDTEYGIQTMAGDEAMFIPVHFTGRMDKKDVSYDLLGSMLMFGAEANKFNALNAISYEVSLMRNVIGERDRGHVRKTDSRGRNIVDRLSRKIGVNEWITKNEESNTYKQLDNFIKNVYYGQERVPANWGKVSMDKIAGLAMKAASSIVLIGNVMQGVNNVTLGNVLMWSEAAAGQFYKRKDLLWGWKRYGAELHNMIKDYGKPYDKSLITMIIEEFDPLQGTFQDAFGKNVSGSKVKKMFQSNSLFFLLNAGEHQMQISTLLAMLHAYKVKDKNGNWIDKDGFVVKTEQEAMNLFEALRVEGGELRVHEKVGNFSRKDRVALTNRLHGINKRLHGVYNSFDKSAAQRHAIGNLAFMFRKWVVSGARRRFQEFRVDQELGTVYEGNYRSFVRVLMSDIADLKFSIFYNWSGYTELEKQNVRRTLVEINALMACLVIFNVLSSLKDDDDETWASNFTAYQARRLMAELLFYTPKFDEAMNILRSPTAVMSFLERSGRLIGQLTSDPGGVYERRSGFHKKGDSKLMARLTDLFPLINQIHTAASPEEALQFYTSKY